MHNRSFSPQLQKKIDTCLAQATPIKLGTVNFRSPIILAPMAGICTSPFRLLMEDLGAGGTVSELISCHGINHGNERTLNMLNIDEREEHVGIQLFGEDGPSMAKAAKVAESYGPQFLDINMGCPVRKVVTKGGGSALLRNIEDLGPFFHEIKKSISIPLSIKIRTGWDADEINAEKIEQIAYNEGIEWVAIHGRTRAQKYTGHANWDYIESLASQASLPIIGNGDLHSSAQVKKRLQNTQCQALMIARGCLRNPFIFLESLLEENGEKSLFHGPDYWEVIERLYTYICAFYDKERMRLVQMRKLIVWFAAGFPGAAKFRNTIFSCMDLEKSMGFAQEYYLGLKNRPKYINYHEVFMNSGHG